jgi:hypothetical protein
MGVRLSGQVSLQNDMNPIRSIAPNAFSKFSIAHSCTLGAISNYRTR